MHRTIKWAMKLYKENNERYSKTHLLVKNVGGKINEIIEKIQKKRKEKGWMVWWIVQRIR